MNKIVKTVLHQRETQNLNNEPLKHTFYKVHEASHAKTPKVESISTV